MLAAGRCGNVIRTLTPLVTSEEKLRGRLAILGRGVGAAPSLSLVGGTVREERTMTPFAVAGMQMRVSATESNVEAMRQRLDTLMAIYPWVQMAVFSELAACGPLPHTAQPLPGPAEEAFREMAAKHDPWLVSGSMYERAGDHIYNTASIINPDGEVVGRYSRYR